MRLPKQPLGDSISTVALDSNPAVSHCRQLRRPSRNGWKLTAVFALVLVSGFVTSGPAQAVSMNFSGNFRTEASTYQNLNLGVAGPGAKNFISSRALLFPNLVIDDHFSLKSQWSLLSSPNFSPNATQALGVGQGGWVFGDPNAASLILSRAWLEWTSDVGVLRAGRMPVAWGYGLVYDAGLNQWDDFQTTFDRIEYRLHLGYVVGALAYSKGRKLSTQGNDNDQEFYVGYLQYNNPEVEVEAGFLFEKQQRSGSQSADLMGSASPYALPSGVPAANRTHLSNRTPWPQSNNLIDAYFKKTSGALTLGGEVAWLSGTATDYVGDGGDNMSAIGVTLNVSYEFTKVKAFLDFLYASGDSNLNDNQMGGFVVLNRNRRPGLILGRELLGNFNNTTVAQGSPVVYGAADTFSGVLYFRPGVRIDWASDWASGIEIIVARKASSSPGSSSNLGVEIDIGAEHAVYKNFGLGVTFGYLIAGEGLGVASPKGPYALRATAAVSF
jgi:hypothetical protein